jgi:hypothetical protein
VTPAQFRRAALRFPEVVEGGHHGHADFRVGGRVIASLGYPSEGCAVVMLSPSDQDLIVRAHAGFAPVPGKWGASGNTVVTLAEADSAAIEAALDAAWRRRAPKKLIAAFDGDSPSAS